MSNVVILLAEKFSPKYNIISYGNNIQKRLGNDPTTQLIDPEGYIITDSSFISGVQINLKSRGMKVETNGIWNINCYNELIKFQRFHNLPVDGKLNRPTIIELG